MRGSCAPAGTVCGHLWLDRVVVHYVGDSSHRQVLSVQECGLGAHAMEGELSTTSADFYPESGHDFAPPSGTRRCMAPAVFGPPASGL